MTTSLDQYLLYIEQPNRDRCKKLLKEHYERFSQAPGSLAKHQAWKGGYLDHLEETMSFAVNLYIIMSSSKRRKLPFTLSSAILVLFLHDLEKPFKYVEPKREFEDDLAKKGFVVKMLFDYHIVLTKEEKNALTYIHGEGSDYHPTQRIQNELAAFTHICDTVSARIWYDYPKK
jgi:hypothetical protein